MQTLPAKAKIIDDEIPTDDLEVQKAQLLANGGLVDFAVRELQAAAAEDKGNWEAPEAARLFAEMRVVGPDPVSRCGNLAHR